MIRVLTVFSFLMTTLDAAGVGVLSNVESAVAIISANRPGRSLATGLRKGERSTFILEEAAVDRYLTEWIAREAQGAKKREVTVKSATVHFKAGHTVEIAAMARVDMGALKALGSEADSVVVQSLKSYLTMDNSMRLECQVSSAKGKIFVKVISVHIKEIPLPVSLVQRILQVVGEHQHPPLDFNRMFPLPNGIERVEVLPGKMVLQVRGL